MGYIKQGDCLELMKEIKDNSIDLIVTDPPYLISRETNFDKGGGWNDTSDLRCSKTPPKYDFGDWDKKELDLDTIFSECYRILKPRASIICFYDIWKITDLKNSAEKAKFKQFRLCKWEKTNPVPVNSKLNYLTNATEYFMTAVKGSNPTFHSEYDRGVYSFPICSGTERTIHPTQKPLNLMLEIIKKHSNVNDIILDPFMGSGTTGVACRELNRDFIGFEINDEYFQIAENRINSIQESLF